jgi:hypothetical protein
MSGRSRAKDQEIGKTGVLLTNTNAIHEGHEVHEVLITPLAGTNP